MAPRLWAATALLVAASAASARPKLPPRVAKGAKDFGGGDPNTPGHLKPMQEQGRPSPVAELQTMPSWEDFYANYVRKNVPVVLRGHAKALKAYKLWTDDYLVKHWGSKSVVVELNKTEERGGKTTEMPLKKFVKEMYRKERKGQLYAILTLNDDKKFTKHVELLKPLRCQEVIPQHLGLWLSSGGTTSVLHYDDAENILMLLAGRKRVMLVHQSEAQKIYARISKTKGTSPVHQDAVDLETFPRFANVSWLQGELGPGDSLYIPHSYWHQVVSYERNLAVNLWWGNREWLWWEPYGKSYKPRLWGTKEAIPFEDLKLRAPNATSCRPLPKGQDLSAAKFWEESKWKSFVQKKYREAHGQKKAEAKRPASKKKERKEL